jgi:hypothetical protein
MATKILEKTFTEGQLKAAVVLGALAGWKAAYGGNYPDEFALVDKGLDWPSILEMIQGAADERAQLSLRSADFVRRVTRPLHGRNI